MFLNFSEMQCMRPMRGLSRPLATNHRDTGRVIVTPDAPRSTLALRARHDALAGDSARFIASPNTHLSPRCNCPNLMTPLNSTHPNATRPRGTTAPKTGETWVLPICARETEIRAKSRWHPISQRSIGSGRRVPRDLLLIQFDPQPRPLRQRHTAVARIQLDRFGQVPLE